MTLPKNLLLKIKDLDKVVSKIKKETPDLFEKIKQDYLEIKRLKTELIENRKSNDSPHKD